MDNKTSLLQVTRYCTERLSHLMVFSMQFSADHTKIFQVILSLSDRDEIFTKDWLGIEVCQNAVFSKIDITQGR